VANIISVHFTDCRRNFCILEMRGRLLLIYCLKTGS